MKGPWMTIFLPSPTLHGHHTHATKKASLESMRKSTCLSSLRAQVHAINSVVPRFHEAQIKFLDNSKETNCRTSFLFLIAYGHFNQWAILHLVRQKAYPLSFVHWTMLTASIQSWMRAPQLLTILNKLYKEARNSRIECRVCSLEIYSRGVEQLGAAELSNVSVALLLLWKMP